RARESGVTEGGAWSVTPRGPNWTVEPVSEPLDWHDIVLADLARPARGQVAAGAVTFADFVASGTFFRYIAASHRYAFFFLVPFLDLVLFVAAGALAGSLLAGARMRPRNLRGVRRRAPAA